MVQSQCSDYTLQQDNIIQLIWQECFSGVSWPPVLDCGTIFHPDHGGQDSPSTPSEYHKISEILPICRL